jgi:hypothetical protein
MGSDCWSDKMESLIGVGSHWIVAGESTSLFVVLLRRECESDLCIVFTCSSKGRMLWLSSSNSN